MIGASSFGRAVNASFPERPKLRPEIKNKTEQDAFIIEGTRENGFYIFVAGRMIPFINYLDAYKWFYTEANLVPGMNDIAIRAYDNIYHKFSDELIFSLMRFQMDFTAQGKKYRVTVNGHDYSNQIQKFEYDSDNKMATSAGSIELLGNYMDNPDFDYDRELVIYTFDGFLDEYIEEFRGKIEAKKFDFQGSDKITKISALHSIIEGLEKVDNIRVSGLYNGQVQKELLARLGIEKVWSFNRYKYTGRRSLNDVKLLDVVRDIAAVQGEIIDFREAGRVDFVPDEYLIAPLFTFDESEVQQLSIEQSKSGMINKIAVVYGIPDKDMKQGGDVNISQMEEPGSEAGFGFYSDETLKNEIKSLPKIGTIFFAAWNKRLDYETIQDAYLELFHTNADFDISNLKYTWPLEIIPDKKLFFTELPLGRLNLSSSSQIQMNLVLSDEEKVLYNPNITMTIDDTLKNESTKLNGFNALFSDETEVASIDRTFSTAADADEKIDPGNPNIVYVKKTSEGSLNSYEFLYKISVQDVVLGSINFNLPEEPNGAAGLYGASIVTEGNIDISGNAYIRAVTFATPRTAFNRVKTLYILFKTVPLESSSVVTIRFKIFGKKFINTEDFIDFDKLKYEGENAESIAKFGLLDGGYIVSNCLSTPDQTETLGKKVLAFYSSPVTTVTLALPFVSELRKNITIKIVSPNAGLNYYYFINSVSKNFDGAKAVAFLMRVTKIKRINGVDSEYDIYSRNMAGLELSPFFNNILGNRGLENGIVTQAHRDGSCDVKVFGTNKKFLRIAVIPKLKVKKDDKVLIAVSVDGLKIVIAILEEKIDEIPERNDSSPKEEKDKFVQGRAEVKPELLTIEPYITPEFSLWREPTTSCKRGDWGSYVGVGFNSSVMLTCNAPVDMDDFMRRIEIKSSAGKSVSGGTWRIHDEYKIEIRELQFEFGTKYSVIVKASQSDPLICLDGKTGAIKNFEFGFETEPKFSIQKINVLNPNVFEVVLTHPLQEGTQLTSKNFLLW